MALALEARHFLLRNSRRTWSQRIVLGREILPSRALFSSVVGQESSSSTQNYPDMGLYRLLGSQERDLLAEQRQLTATCRDLAGKVLAFSNDKDDILAKLDSFKFLNLEATFSVVIAGEFNAGKSTLINALIGKKELESGALPTTDSITIVASSDSLDTSLPLGVVWRTVANVPLLEDLTLVDTPGTNSAWLDHTEQTLRLLPSADLILFVTSADRPFSDSERILLEEIQAYRKNIVILVNKMDILDTDGGDHGQKTKQAVADFVMERSSEILGARPVVIPLSARDALSAKLLERKITEKRSNLWDRSQFGELERFLKDSLTTQTKLKSKLTNPIGVCEGVAKECLRLLDEQHTELQSDIATLAVLDSQFEGWKKELALDLQTFRQGTTQLVRKRGERWDQILQRMSFWDFCLGLLIDRSKFEKDWRDIQPSIELYGRKELKDDILAQVEEISELVATRGRAQGQAVIEYLGKRPAMKNQSLVGSVTAASRFEDTRKNLSERLSMVVDSTLDPNEESREKEEGYRSLRIIASICTGLQSGAVIAALATTIDLVEVMSGIAIASSMIISSGAYYHWGTTRTIKYYDTKWLDRAESFDAALAGVCDKEVLRVSRRILEGIGPYTRFVYSEQDRIKSLQQEFKGLSLTAHNLRNRILRHS